MVSMPKGIYTRGTIIRNPHSEETRLKIGLAHLGKTISDETKLKLSLVKMGCKYPNRKRYSKGITKIDKVCLFCKNPFQTDCLMPNKKFCSQTCYHKTSSHITTLGMKGSEKQKQVMRERTGEKHFAWIKDRTQVKRRFKESLSTAKYQEWRTKVFARDNFKCKMLNKDCSGKYIEAHHILRLKDYPELSYVITNGITLCKFHHPIGKEKETKLVSTFRKLLTIL